MMSNSVNWRKHVGLSTELNWTEKPVEKECGWLYSAYWHKWKHPLAIHWCHLHRCQYLVGTMKARQTPVPRCLSPKISATLFVMPAQYLHQDFSDARPASAMCFRAQCENPTLSSHFQWYNSSHWELVWKTQLFFSITWMSYILSINRRVQYTFPKLQNLSYHTLPVVWNRSYKNQAVFKKKKKSSTEQELFAVLKYLPDWSNYCSAWT